MRSSLGIGSVALAAALATALTGGVGTALAVPKPPTVVAPLVNPYYASQPMTFLSPTSVWDAPVPANAPLDPNQGPILANFLAQQASESMNIATTSYGVAIYVVPPDQPTITVTLTQNSGNIQNVQLQNAFDAVPLPPNAQPAGGTDGNLIVYQPSTDLMWEFWRLQLTSSGWTAGWGGRLVNESQNSGYYSFEVDPVGNVLEEPGWGAPADSSALIGGTMTIQQLESGAIGHALELGISNTCNGIWNAPAERTDGKNAFPNCVPEGAHFILNPNVDLASLNLPPFTLMMAQAAQQYGIIVNNRSKGFTFRAEDPTQFKQEYGYTPYTGPRNGIGSAGAMFSQTVKNLLLKFPWQDLELMQMTTQTQASWAPTVVVPTAPGL